MPLAKASTSLAGASASLSGVSASEAADRTCW